MFLFSHYLLLTALIIAAARDLQDLVIPVSSLWLVIISLIPCLGECPVTGPRQLEAMLISWSVRLVLCLLCLGTDSLLNRRGETLLGRGDIALLGCLALRLEPPQWWRLLLIATLSAIGLMLFAAMLGRIAQAAFFAAAGKRQGRIMPLASGSEPVPFAPFLLLGALFFPYFLV